VLLVVSLAFLGGSFGPLGCLWVRSLGSLGLVFAALEVLLGVFVFSSDK
jgi:hypothetical protein